MHPTTVLCTACLLLGPMNPGPPAAKEAPKMDPQASAKPIVPIQGGLTPHFLQWLGAHGYGGFRFDRSDLLGGSYGGRGSAAEPVLNPPVIFVHGNSDKALGTGSPGQTGWNASIEYFLAHGYKTSELYATTWGPADPVQALNQYHSRDHVTRLRAFIRAVKDYTGAAKVAIIAHSMGVTLARKAILGGAGSDPVEGGAYELGPPLTSSVDTFIGIAGANWGLSSCARYEGVFPTCGSANGFYPGSGPGPAGLSAFLAGLNASAHYEGSKVYSIWSPDDELIGSGGLVWGRPTAPIPGQDGEKILPLGHFGLKDLTAPHQWRMVKLHATQ